MRTYGLSIALVAAVLGAGCVGSDDASNNLNNGPPPNPMWIDHMIESVTVDASENTVTVSGVFRPSEAYAQECTPFSLGTSEIVHVVALYPDAEDYRPYVWQYSDATPISTEEFEARAEAAWLNEFNVPVQLNGIEGFRTGSFRRHPRDAWGIAILATGGAQTVIDFTNGTHAFVQLYCGACTERGVCRDGWCDEGEAGCWQDCPEPLVAVCGDGWCAASEFSVCPADCTNLP